MAVSVLVGVGRANRFGSRLRPFRPDSARGHRVQRELGPDGAGQGLRRPPLLPARPVAGRIEPGVDGAGLNVPEGMMMGCDSALVDDANSARAGLRARSNP